MWQYLEDTNKMVAEGKHAEALKRHIWFHDNTLKKPDMPDGLLSDALTHWIDLATIYPPAKEALIAIRDRKTKTIKKAKAKPLIYINDKKPNLFHDVVSINEYLSEEEKSLSLFEYLDKNNPAVAEENWLLIKDDVIAAKRFDLAVKYMGKPMDAFNNARKAYSISLKVENILGDEYRGVSNDSFVKDVLNIIKVAVATGKKAEAKEIRALALDVLEDDRIRNADITDN